MIYEKTETFLVAMREDGKFFATDESFASTTPYFVDHPVDAKRIVPYAGEKEIQPAPYYFENSDRMRRWLYGCKMVTVTLKSYASLTHD